MGLDQLFGGWSAAVTPFALALLGAAVLCAFLGALGWRRRAKPGGVQFLAMMTAATVWALFYALELTAPALTGKVLFAKVEYLGIVALPLAWLLFARSHTGVIGRLDRRFLVLASLIPVATVALAATNEFHHLLWSKVSINTSGPFPVLALVHGSWFWVHVTYSYALLALGSFLLLRAVYRFPHVYRGQAGMLLVAILAPWLGNIWFVLGQAPPKGLDLTPFAFTITGVALALSVSRFHLFNLLPGLLPAATNRVLETMKDGVVVLDVDGQVVSVNPAACTILRAPSFELIGSKVPAILGDNAAGGLAGARDLDSQFEITLGEAPSESTCHVVSSPLGLGGGIGFGRLLVIRDVTERIEAERNLRERDDQLRQAQKMEAIGQLAGGIAHDFNNLLTAIIGYSDLILASEDCAGGSLREDVGEIKTAADRAAALTRQILAFSRRQALQPEVVSLNDIVAGTERLLRRTLGEDIEVVTLLRPELGEVEVDASQFEQVLTNLALNSRDAMEHGGKLTIETSNAELSDEYCRSHVELAPGSYVMLAVSDTGTGMDSETQARVFEPFFTTKEPGKGSGLGLSTVYGTVKQSGGGVFICSEPSAGTTVKVYLPRVDRPKKRRLVKVLGADPVSGNETILLVEDEKAVRDLARRVLEGRGYEVISAVNGDDALALMDEPGRQVDMLLTDVVLPGTMQGNELARAVQELCPESPVLYVSGYTRDAIVHAGRLDEGVNYLEKPFTPDGLARCVREVLDARLAAD